EERYVLRSPEDSGPFHFGQTRISAGLGDGWELTAADDYDRPPGGPLTNDGFRTGVTRALAPWGDIPLNPALAFEFDWRHREEDRMDVRLNLADEFGACVHWAGNVY